MSIGIVAFAFVSLLGLIPTGLGVFKQSMDYTVSAQIAQRAIADAQQTDFTSLLNGSAPVFCRNTRFFDAEGNELNGPQGAIYHVRTRVAYPISVPSSNGNISNDSIARVTVQVASNPGNQHLVEESADPATKLLWTGALGGQPNNRAAVPLFTFSAYISRIK